MAGDDNDKRDIPVDIPESAFEEALRAVERVQQASKQRKAAKARPRGADSDVAELESLLSALDGGDEVEVPIETEEAPPASASMSELDILAKLLEEEQNLEREAEFLKTVLSESARTPGPAAPGDDAALVEKQKESRTSRNASSAWRRSLKISRNGSTATKRT
ncbi:MAG: hypothetical protein M5R36_27970 [Deltaproteobacteria bacterium]|nr:hypothetical protein [Deltaproteobacteria bacterium]